MVPKGYSPAPAKGSLDAKGLYSYFSKKFVFVNLFKKNIYLQMQLA